MEEREIAEALPTADEQGRIEKKRTATHRYPAEGRAWLAGITTFILVFLPCLAVVISPPLVDPPRAYTVIFGNWMSPFILWCASATAVFLFTKRLRLRREVNASWRLVEGLASALGVQDAPRSNREREIRGLLNESRLWAGEHNLLRVRCAALLDANFRAPTQGETLDAVAGRLSEVDRNACSNSFGLPKVLVWATPILGFIGTVWGISSAVSEFSAAAGSYGNAAAAAVALSESLPGVTRGLALAFDSTFLALMCALLLSFVLSSIERRERGYLDRLDRTWLRAIAPSLQSLLALRGQNADAEYLSNSVLHATAKVRALDAALRDLSETSYLAGVGPGVRDANSEGTL